MSKPSPLPAALANRPFTTAAARAAGLTRARTRMSDLAAPYRGVRVPTSEPLTLEHRCASYAERMPEGHYFSHATAAQLHGLPLPARIQRDPTIHVSVIAPDVPPRMRGVAGHRTETDARTVLIGALRVATAVDVWRQMAATLWLDDLVAVGDALVRRQHPLASMTELREMVSESAGVRGVKRLRTALAMVRPGVDSPMETMIRLMVVRGGLPEPEVNPQILSRRGAFLAFGDMVYPSFKVLVEYDGEHHFASEEQGLSDVDRLDRLMEEHWRVIRFNKTHVRREATVVDKVRTALLDAGWRP